LLAERQGEVLVIDANLARRSLTDGMQAGAEQGLGELLRGNTPPRERCRPTAFSRVSFLPAGQLRHVDPSTAGQRLEEIVRQLASEFSLVLVDGGRAGDLAATTLARLCDATYFVVRLGTVEANEAQAALRDYRTVGARVLGCIAT
jgi:Mrp family chromosome partitioning ATPase